MFNLPGMKQHRIKLAAAALLPAFFFLLPLAAQDNGGAATNRHSLWKVEGKSNAVYLLGSVHLLKAENFPLPAPIESAYSNAQVVVFETDVEKLEDPAVQIKMMSKAQLPPGETLKGRLSAGTYAAFASHAKENGLPPELLDTLKPSMAAMMIEVLEISKMGADPEKGLDKYFDGRARKEGKQVIGLEPVDFQIDLVTSFSKEEEEMMMKTTLEDLDKGKQEFGDIIKAWQTGDSAAIEKLLNESLKEAPALCKRMLTDRNKNWVPKIEELLRGDKNALVIVGAAHLVGDEGVVKLLEKKGLKVPQL
jgi:hypothetical protein